jgi:hypothetical protein
MLDLAATSIDRFRVSIALASVFMLSNWAIISCAQSWNRIGQQAGGDAPLVLGLALSMMITMSHGIFFLGLLVAIPTDIFWFRSRTRNGRKPVNRAIAWLWLPLALLSIPSWQMYGALIANALK